MNSATQWRRLTASILVVGMFVVGGFLFSGCSPSPEPADTGGGPAPGFSPAPGPSEEPAEPSEPSAEEPAEPAEEPAEPMEPAEEPAKPEAQAAELPLNPAVSTYAPAEDLASQVQAYIEDLEEAVENEEEYNDSVEKIAQKSNTLILIALGLGLNDGDDPLKVAAPAILKAAQQLALAKDFAGAKAGVDAVKAAAASTDGDPAALEWDKVASLPELMKAVPLINTRLKRYIRKGREEKAKGAAADLAGHAAVLAVIAQGSMANAGETEQPNEVEKWQAFCVQMRAAAAGVNAGIREFGQEGAPAAFEATQAAMQELAQSCD
ncbi:MAG: hypothetical protein HQ582_03830, partial [Planctomycetes bacterium]|nr:hypothetical protein [Planctomycetota bacterium]